MRRRFRAGGLAVAIVAGAAAMGGCGAATAVRNTVDPVAKAAETTAKVPGYRIQATMTMTLPTGPAHVTMDGVFNRTRRTGTMTTHESVLGHTVNLTEKFSGLTFWMSARSLPGAERLTHGKPWLKYDMSKALSAMGLGSIPTTGTDPSQFLDYLRAVSSKETTVGAQTVRGVSTTHYRATIDLDRYAKLLKGSSRASAGETVSTLESALGSHSLPIDVWIDSQRLVRRMAFDMKECVAQQHLAVRMTMDLFDYGRQPATTLPADSETYDLTPLASRLMRSVKLGCTTA